jgi:ATP-dependent Lon protease
VQVLELRNTIASRAQTEMSKEQRDYMLRQQLRAIQDELGEQTPEKAEVAAKKGLEAIKEDVARAWFGAGQGSASR